MKQAIRIAAKQAIRIAAIMGVVASVVWFGALPVNAQDSFQRGYQQGYQAENPNTL